MDYKCTTIRTGLGASEEDEQRRADVITEHMQEMSRNGWRLISTQSDRPSQLLLFWEQTG